MRIALVGLALLGLVSEASAAELGDVIRGSTPYVPGVPTYHNWEGFYAGGRVLPYAASGVAAGRANVAQAAIVSEAVSAQDGTFLRNVPTETATNTKAAYIWGYEAGDGLDVEVIPGIMLRAEYEFVQF